MNLKWANLGRIYSPIIAPNMGKHCDVGHSLTRHAGIFCMRTSRDSLSPICKPHWRLI